MRESDKFTKKWRNSSYLKKQNPDLSLISISTNFKLSSKINDTQPQIKGITKKNLELFVGDDILEREDGFGSKTRTEEDFCRRKEEREDQKKLKKVRKKDGFGRRRLELKSWGGEAAE